MGRARGAFRRGDDLHTAELVAVGGGKQQQDRWPRVGYRRRQERDTRHTDQVVRDRRAGGRSNVYSARQAVSLWPTSGLRFGGHDRQQDSRVPAERSRSLRSNCCCVPGGLKRLELMVGRERPCPCVSPLLDGLRRPGRTGSEVKTWHVARRFHSALGVAARATPPAARSTNE